MWHWELRPAAVVALIVKPRSVSVQELDRCQTIAACTTSGGAHGITSAIER